MNDMNEQSGNSGQLQPDAGSGGDARAQFEAWAIRKRRTLYREPNGTYEDHATHLLWEAWRAAIAAKESQ